MKFSALLLQYKIFDTLLAVQFTIFISVIKEYKYSTSKKSWDDAQKSCKIWGGNLVTIESSEENDQVVKELKSRWVKFP